jgi:hypothetical protein
VVKIFLIILVVIAILFLIGYIIYRMSRRDGDTGFQDFLIDSIAHSKKPQKEQATPITTSSGENTIIVSPKISETNTPIKNDPLGSPVLVSSVAETNTSTLIVTPPAATTTSPIVVDPLAVHTEEVVDHEETMPV